MDVNPKLNLFAIHGIKNPSFPSIDESLQHKHKTPSSNLKRKKKQRLHLAEESEKVPLNLLHPLLNRPR
ncbi:hypothetical protein C5167_007882, partial [Papaver somniferum]